MSMFFEEFLASLPASRSDLVHDLDLPEDVTVTPFLLDMTAPLTDTTDRADSLTVSDDDSDSSLALSRAMTDSDIEYDMYKRLLTRRRSDPWAPLRAATLALPPEHLAAVSALAAAAAETDAAEDLADVYMSRPVFDEELVSRMRRFFDEECTVFADDDLGLAELQDALAAVNLSSLEPDEDIYIM